MAPQGTYARLRRSGPRLSTAAVARMQELPWFADLGAEERSWVGLVAQAGIAAFCTWLRDPSARPAPGTGIFSAAPRELARVVSLQQTVQLIRLTVDVLEEAVPSLAVPGEQALLEQALLRYSREVAFAAAEIYAAAAEERGGWDARLEASVVEALARGRVGEAVASRAASLGWGRPAWVAVAVGAAPEEGEAGLAELRSLARHAGQALMVGDAGGCLAVVLGGPGPSSQSVRQVSALFGPGAVVLGPVLTGPEAADLEAVSGSLREAVAGFASAPAWPGAPRPVPASELLAERAVLGDVVAQRRLREEVAGPLLRATGGLEATVSAYLDNGGSVEATARALFLHPNTVRYRLRKAWQVTGHAVTDPRGAEVVRVALVLARGSAL